MVHHIINTFSRHYRDKYGQGVGKIPLDAGIPCPNREHGGCIFCHAGSFTPTYLNGDDTIAAQLKQGKDHLLRDRFKLFFGYFQQETTTALSPGELFPMLEKVLTDTACVGIIISTRPDFLDQFLLEQLAKLAHQSEKEFLLEIGLQSFNEKSLELLNRNHSVADFIDGVSRIKALESLQVGVHLILGLPGESQSDMRASIRSVCELGVHAIKLHHLQVIRDTPLHVMYRQQKTPLFTAESYLELLASLLPEIPENIVIHRLWSHSHPDLLVAPRWNMFAGELSVRLQKMMAEQEVYQGKYKMGL